MTYETMLMITMNMRPVATCTACPNRAFAP